MKKLTSILLLALVAVLVFTAIPTSAKEAYDTYTYSIDGTPLKSPTAYKAENVVEAFDMNIGKLSSVTSLQNAKDVVTDKDSNVYIADTGNNRIVVLDKYYHAKAIISEYTDEFGKTQVLNQPEGVFVTTNIDTKERLVYVCDTGNAQIVVFREQANGTFAHSRTIEKPDTPLLKAEAFKPSSVAVDQYGRVFVVSKSCFEGVIVMSSEGDFTGFIGIQKVTYSLIEMIWKRFQTASQKESAVKRLADPYNNITVDEEGFIYVTTTPSSGDGKKQQLASVTSKSADTSPVKKLNSAGNEIMKRNGFFDPGGEVDIRKPEEISIITDVAVGEEGAWTILDQSRSRVFTYDQNGNLLFAYGGQGEQLGNIAKNSAVSITYHEVNGVYYFMILDNDTSGSRLTVYTPTTYYNTIISALYNENRHNYSESINCWKDILKLNNNFDLAYIGIGKALYNQGRFEEAQLMLESACEVDVHSKAFIAIRKEFIQKWLLPLVIGIIVLLVLFFKFLGYAKKKNKATSLKVGKKTYWEELLYAFHLVFHPFDGFWDLKHEKRGSVRASATIMLLTILAFFYQAIGQGYSFNPKGDYSTVFIQLLAVALPVLLWCVGNWCLTTLFDGEGNFKNIFIATGYSLAPLPLFIILSTILSNVMTASEGSIVTMLVSIGYVWVFLLLFFGTMVTHNYTMGKNFITVIGTILAMAIIIFIAVLFSSLVVKMVSFIIAVITEAVGRV